MKLSILICSLHTRAHFLARLLAKLGPQTSKDVEIITDVDGGEKTIGKKRNDLLDKAVGDYVAFIDDDDLISDDYISKIINAITNNPDCCGIEGIMTVNGHHPKKFIHSIKYDKWFEQSNIYYRSPNHLSPVKRSIATTIRFPEINFGEDKEYSKGIQPLIKTESYINGPIYFYEYITDKNKTKSNQTPINQKSNENKPNKPDRPNKFEGQLKLMNRFKSQIISKPKTKLKPIRHKIP